MHNSQTMNDVNESSEDTLARLLGLTDEQPQRRSQVKTIDLVGAVSASQTVDLRKVSPPKTGFPKKASLAIQKLPSETPSKQASNNKLPMGRKENANKPRPTRPKSRPNTKAKTPLKIDALQRPVLQKELRSYNTSLKKAAGRKDVIATRQSQEPLSIKVLAPGK